LLTCKITPKAKDLRMERAVFERPVEKFGLSRRMLPNGRLNVHR
jgi:hypothetical protein